MADTATKTKAAFMLIIEQKGIIFSKRAIATNISWKLKNSEECGRCFAVIPLPATKKQIDEYIADMQE